MKQENNKYIDYIKKIEALSKHIFLDDPFSLAIFQNTENSNLYREIFLIRNFVAHESEEARAKFISSCLGGNEAKFSDMNTFLTAKVKNTKLSKYTNYINALKTIVIILTDPRPFI